MLCFWVINSARLPGIKYYQKSLGLRVDLQGRAYQEDQSSRLSTKVFQSGLWGLALLTALLLRRKLIPSLQLADGPGSAPTKANLVWKGWNLDLGLPDCNFCTSSAEWWPHTSLTRGKITGEREVPYSLLPPTSPLKEYISFSEDHFLC